MRPSGDTARGFVFDDFVDKQVVHVSATSFRSGAERVSMSNQKQNIRVVIEFVSQLSAMLSGEVYLILKPYLVVQISSDIVTEHCCQVCVLSVVFCRSDCRLDMVSDFAIREPRGLTCRVWLNSGRPTRDIKYSSHFIFKFYINRDTSVLELFHVVVFQQKYSPCWPRQSSLKLLACGRKIHNDVHIDTYYCKPELISWR